MYVTRLQRERLPEASAAAYALPSVDARFLAAPAFSRAIVMHPLPRNREVDPALDSDRRAAYFRQAAAGVPVRMVLLQWALGRLDLDGPDPDRPPSLPAGGRDAGERVYFGQRAGHDPCRIDSHGRWLAALCIL